LAAAPPVSTALRKTAYPMPKRPCGVSPDK
jgi:hypothetical protein